MRRLRFALALFAVAVILVPSRAFAETERERERVLAESRLWVELGSRSVDFHKDRDEIEVGRQEGRFTHLRFKVEEGDLVVDKIRVTFADGKVWESDYRAEFKEGARSHDIAMPEGARMVRKVDFIARSEHRHDPAKIVLLGKEAAGPAVVVRPETVVVKEREDEKLWVELGSRSVDFHKDRDEIEVGKSEGRFTHLRFKVEEGDLVLDKIRVTYADGKVWESDYRAEFKEGQRSHEIEFPKGAHGVRKVDFIARSEHRRDPAKVVLLGKEAR